MSSAVHSNPIRIWAIMHNSWLETNYTHFSNSLFISIGKINQNQIKWMIKLMKIDNDDDIGVIVNWIGNRIADAGRFRSGVASDALGRGAPAFRVRGRPQRRHERTHATGIQRIRTGRRQILPGETHQDGIPRMNHPLKVLSIDFMIYLLTLSNSY